jgi:hypothetical protein
MILFVSNLALVSSLFYSPLIAEGTAISATGKSPLTAKTSSTLDDKVLVSAGTMNLPNATLHQKSASPSRTHPKRRS